MWFEREARPTEAIASQTKPVPSKWHAIPNCGNSFSQASDGFLTASRLTAGSKFISHSQLVYGPCMSSLTAAVFTSRLQWYRKTGRGPATVSSSLLLAFISPLCCAFQNKTSAWKVYPRQAPWLCRNDDRKRHCFTVWVLWLLCWALFETPAVCVHVTQEMLQFISVCGWMGKSDSSGIFSSNIKCEITDSLSLNCIKSKHTDKCDIVQWNPLFTVFTVRARCLMITISHFES